MVAKAVVAAVLAATCCLNVACAADSQSAAAADDSVEYYYQQGQAYLAKGDYGKANESFKKAEMLVDNPEADVAPAETASLPAGLAPVAQKEKAIQEKQPAKSAVPVDEKTALLDKAKKLCAKGDILSAIEVYEELCKKDPKSADLRYNLGILYVRLSDYNKAIINFEEVLRSNSHDKESLYNLGVIYEGFLGDSQKAMAYYRRYMRTLPQGVERATIKKWIEYLEEQKVR